jgi:predicted nuclease of predicted toxin-antitoxin system
MAFTPAVSFAGKPSVILLRIEGLNAERQAELIRAVWEACGEAIAEGAAVSTDGATLGFRRLPLK